jgi:hypothetical protein
MPVELDERDVMGRVDLAQICRDVRFAGPLVPALDEIHRIAPLLIAQHFGRRKRKFTFVVRTHCMRRPARPWTVEEKNHPRDFVQLDEVRALLAQLIGPDEITPARRQGAATTWDIEAVEARKLELTMEKRISLRLKASVGASDDESMRSVGRPFGVCV